MTRFKPFADDLIQVNRRNDKCSRNIVQVTQSSATAKSEEPS